MKATRHEVLIGSLILVGLGLAILAISVPSPGDPGREIEGRTWARSPSSPASDGVLIEIPEAPTPARSATATEPPEIAIARFRNGGMRSSSALHGRVTDLEGHPKGGLEIIDESRPEAVLGVSSADGTFTVAVPEPGSFLIANGPGVATLLKHLWLGGVPATRATIVVAPAVELAGRVVDTDGNGLPGATLWLERGTRTLEALGVALDSNRFCQLWTKSSEEGWFSLHGVPTGHGLHLRVTKEGFLGIEAPVPGNDVASWTIVLRRGDGAGPFLRGTVSFPDGKPAAGATVRLGDFRESTAGPGGEFALEASDLEPGTCLLAWKAGYLPARVEDVLASLGRVDGAQEPLNLVLGEVSRSIQGSLVTGEGEPVPGWTVKLASGTEISRHKLPPELLEERIATLPEPRETSEHGRFSLDGLLARSYVLRFQDPKSHAVFESVPIDAGTSDLIVELPLDLLKANLRGRVVSAGGRAVSEARITALLGTKSSTGFSTTPVKSTTADPSGRFELHTVPRRGLYLSISGEEIATSLQPVPESDEGSELEFTVWLKCHFRVLCSSGNPPDSLSVVDAEDHPLLIHGLGQENGLRFPFEGHASEVWTVDERARVLVLYRGDRELRRVSLLLRPGELVRVDI